MNMIQKYTAALQSYAALRKKTAGLEPRRTDVLNRMTELQDKISAARQENTSTANPPESVFPDHSAEIPVISEEIRNLEQNIFSALQGSDSVDEIVEKIKKLQAAESPVFFRGNTPDDLRKMTEYEARLDDFNHQQSEQRAGENALKEIKSALQETLSDWMKKIRDYRPSEEAGLLKQIRGMEKDILSDFDMAYLRGFAGRAEAEQGNILSGHLLDDGPVPIAKGFLVDDRGERFLYPVVLEDGAFFICCDVKKEESCLRKFFNMLLAQTLLHTRSGQLEIRIADGYWLADFSKKMLSQFVKTEPGKQAICKCCPDASSPEEFSAQLKNCWGALRESIDTLASSGLDFEQYNHTDSLPGMPRRLVLINGLEKFISSYRGNADLRLLAEIAAHAHKAGFILICVGTEEAYQALSDENKDHPLRKSILHNGEFILGNSRVFPQLFDEAVFIDFVSFMRRSRESQKTNSVDFIKMIAKTPFTKSSADDIFAPFAQDASGSIIGWQCSSNMEPGQTLLIGGTGSGKSNLMHAVITSCCYHYSPLEAQLYLIDLKEGLEFKIYSDQHLPHARLIATEGDRGMALGCLRNIWGFYESRSRILKAQGVENITAYRQQCDTPMARIILFVDEFQVLFSEQDKLSNEAESILNNLITKGRAAGIHVFLSTQNPSGIPMRIIKNVTTKIVMRCESDIVAQMFSNGNQLAKQLTQIGMGFFASADNKNEPRLFRAAYMDKEIQKRLLQTISQLSEKMNLDYHTILYDGATFPTASADFCRDFYSHNEKSRGVSILCGEGDNLADSVWFRLMPDFGENLLVVGKTESTDEDSVSGMTLFYKTLADAFLHNPQWNVSVYDPSGHMESLRHAETCRNAKELGNVLFRLRDMLNKRENTTQSEQTPHILLLLDAHRLNGLVQLTEAAPIAAPPPVPTGLIPLVPTSPRTPSVDKNALAALRALLNFGAANNIYVIAATGNLNMFVQNWFDGRGSELKNFNHRVAFQISEQDSSSLLNLNGAASKLGMYHAMYFNVNENTFQRFRPFHILENADL